MKAYITRGLPGSGKTTWAKQFCAQHPNTIRINNDEIRNHIYGEQGSREWSSQVEAEVARRRTKALMAAAARQLDVVIDNTHISENSFKNIKEECKRLGYKVEIVDFLHVPVDECIRRDAQRPKHEQVGEQVIREMYEKIKNQFAANSIGLPDYTPTGKERCIIVDIDGTLANMDGGRNPYDETSVYQDKPRKFVLMTVVALMEKYKPRVFIFSGRSERCREETMRWLLDKCGLLVDGERVNLVMRQSGDTRKDALVKRDMYDAYVRGKYDVLAVFDDRASVVRELWAAENLPVFRCGVFGRDNF